MALESALGSRVAPGVRRGGGTGRRGGDKDDGLGARVARGGDGGGDCTDEAETKVSSEEPDSRLAGGASGVGARRRAAVEVDGAGDVALALAPLGLGGVGGRAPLAGCGAGASLLLLGWAAETCLAARTAASTLGFGFSTGLWLEVLGFTRSSSLVPTGVLALDLTTLGVSTLTGSPLGPPPSLGVGVVALSGTRLTEPPASVPSNIEIKFVVPRMDSLSGPSEPVRTGLTPRPVARFAAMSESAARPGLVLLVPPETSDLAGETSRWFVLRGASRPWLGSRLGALEVAGVGRPSLRPVGEEPLWKASRAPWSAGAEVGMLT